MNSRFGPTPKYKGSFNSEVDQLARGFARTKLAPSQDYGGEWDFFSEKYKNRSEKSYNPNFTRAWGGQQQGRRNNVYGRGNAYGCGTQANGFRVSAGQGRRYDNNYALDDDYDEDFASDDYYSDDVYGKWTDLSEEENDFKIVWPPMVIIMNTRLYKDYYDMWIGMGNQELLDYFDEYEPIRGLNSYGPQGHRGMSVLIFESNASGYVKAEFLDKVLALKGLGRDALDRSRGLFYGFLATKQDIDVFNQYSNGKTRLRFEMRSYRKMVVEDVREIYDENQLLKYYKNQEKEKIVENAQEKYLKNENKKLKEHVEKLDETLRTLKEKLRETVEDNRIVRLRTKMQHELIKEQMDSQERFFKESTKRLQENKDVMEENRDDEVSSFINAKEKEEQEFVEVLEEKEGKEELIKEQEKKKWYYQEMLFLESQFNEFLHPLFN